MPAAPSMACLADECDMTPHMGKETWTGDVGVEELQLNLELWGLVAQRFSALALPPPLLLLKQEHVLPAQLMLAV